MIIRGNALDLPLADNSVDLIVTSPPYFGLRSYQDDGEHYAGQIGSEATPAEFVDALIAATREMMRVLKPSGSIWVNLGDKYSGAQAQNINGASRAGDSAKVWAQTNPKNTGIPNKSLMGIPWRYALRCIDDLGLILRAEIIWSKPNGLPESVTDRVRRSHEQWFHFTVSPRYFSAVDEIREGIAESTRQRWGSDLSRRDATGGRRRDLDVGNIPGEFTMGCNPLGKLPGSVWTIATQPLTVPAELGIDHFAAFPMEWPRRIIAGWSPSGICTACGEGRRPVMTGTAEPNERLALLTVGRAAMSGGTRMSTLGRAAGEAQRSIIGYACACYDDLAHNSHNSAPPTTPSTVLDPFGGTGTTALVAKALGRTGISVDMSADYCRIATWRCNDPGQMAAALQVEKPESIPADQLSLFEDDFVPAKPDRPSGGLALSKARGQDCLGCGYRMQYAARATCEKCGEPRGAA